MNTLTQLFDWLLAASLRASLLTLATLLIQAALHRHLGARMRYALWLPVLIVLLMPVFPQSQWSLEHVFQTPPQPVQIISEPITPMMDAAPVVFEAPAPMPEPINWQCLFLITWVGVSTGMLIFGSISLLLTLRRFKQARHPVSDELLTTLAQIAREMHLRQVPRVLIASSVSSPAVTGLLRPTLLLPAEFDREFTPAEARLVLKHELMHLKRGDLPLNALMCVLMALHWFNPLLWIAFFKIRADREAACDAQVLLNAPADRRIEYGHALLKVETAFCPRGFSLGFVGIFQRGAALRPRIQSIAAHRAPHPAMKVLITLCIVLMTFLGITRAAPDWNEASLISIEARFIELTFPSDQPSAPDNALAELLAGIDETQSNDRAMKAVLHDTQYQTLIRKLSQKKGIDLLTMPTVTVRSGQKASMEFTREFAPLPKQKPSEQKVGVTLNVMPTLTDKDSLELTMNPRVVEFEGFSKAENGEQKPIYSERKADTSAKMKPGQTALIDVGSKTDSQTVEDRIDGKVIISTRHLTRRVFVFVTARLVDKKTGNSSKTVFTPGKSAFRPGDSILITSMTRSDDMLTVELDYELNSTDKATAALYITSTTDDKSSPFDAGQQAAVKRGRGSLVLHHPMPVQGLPHVTFYDSSTHKPFGGIYFGTEAEAAESKKLNLSYMTASAETKTAPTTDFIKSKLNEIIIPSVQFQGATVQESLEYLRIKSRELSPDPAAPSVSIIYKESNPPSKAVISMDLKDVPLGEALRYVVELASLKMIIQPYAVLIVPADDPETVKSATSPSAHNNADKLGEIVITAQDTSIDPSTEIQTAKGDARCQVGDISIQAAELICDRKAHQLKIRGPFTIISGGNQKHSSTSSESSAVLDLASGKLTTSGAHETEILTLPADKIIIPSVEFRDATLTECIDFMRIKSRDLDPDKKGVNIVVKPGGDASARIMLSLKNVPLLEALRYCAELANHKLTFDAQSYFLTPVSAEAPADKDQASGSSSHPPASAAEAKAAEMRKARPQQYDFNKAPLGDVLRFIATDAGINFFALPDNNPINQKIITFNIRASPFEVLETLCRANGLALFLDQDRWFIRAADDPKQVGKALVFPQSQAVLDQDLSRIRAADDPEQIGKGYVLPQTLASVETIVKDISSILDGGETKPAADKPQPSVTFKKEQNSVYVMATRLQHTWVSAYFLGLSGSAQSRKTK